MRILCSLLGRNRTIETTCVYAHGKTHFSLGFFTILSLSTFSLLDFLLPPPFSLERETTILLNPLDDKEK